MDNLETAIERIRTASEIATSCYGRPIQVAYSGGKDSDVLVELFFRSGVPFSVEHSLTTVDAPQTVYHVREKFREWSDRGVPCHIRKPARTMWKLIVKEGMPPTRIVRYCCRELKENTGTDAMVATGVRWAESSKRTMREEFEIIAKKKEDRIGISSGILRGEAETGEQLPLLSETLLDDNTMRRKFMEQCYRKRRSVVNPIIDWSDKDVWEFCNSEQLILNPLYKMGFTRVGCIGCPMAGAARERQFRLFPAYKHAYLSAFDRMVRENKTRWRDAQEVFDWWMGEKDNLSQMTII